MNTAESLPLLEDIQSYVNHVFNTVRHLPTICFYGSRPKEFLRKKIFVKTKKTKELMVPSIPLVIFTFCSTKNLFK